MTFLKQIAEVPPGDLRTLAQESPQSQRGVEALERAAASLYKALQAGRDQGEPHWQSYPSRYADPLQLMPKSLPPSLECRSTKLKVLNSANESLTTWT